VSFKVPLALPAFEEPEELARTGFDRPSLVARRKLAVTMGDVDTMGDPERVPQTPPAQRIEPQPTELGAEA
jgi:hypothetical protein